MTDKFRNSRCTKCQWSASGILVVHSCPRCGAATVSETKWISDDLRKRMEAKHKQVQGELFGIPIVSKPVDPDEPKVEFVLTPWPPRVDCEEFTLDQILILTCNLN